MAKLALDLSQFKSAGVFTIEIDQSERITVTTQSLRLVPGFSKVGPFNTPVFIRSTRDRQKYYGELDLKLERKGSFFHRSIDTCLLQAPVFAINLLKANDVPDASANVDKVDAIGFSIDTSVNNKAIVTDFYINFFNRERFWKADPGYLQGIITNKYLSGSEESAPLLQLSNVGTRDISFIVRKAVGLQGYSVFAKDWYGSAANIPFEWIRESDIIKDYFIQIIAVEGDWTNYLKLSTDPFFADYFSVDGILPNKLTDFINLPSVNLLGSWTGTIIPEFRDQTGANQYIEDIVNASTPLTGVLLNVNHEALDQLIWDENQDEWELGDGSSTDVAPFIVDLVGHNLINVTGNITKSFLSYSIDVSNNVLHTTLPITLIGSTGKQFSLAVDASNSQTLLTVGTLVKKDPTASTTGAGVTYVTAKIYDGSVYQYETAEPVFNYAGNEPSIYIQKTIDDASIATAYKFIQLDGLHLTNNHLPGYNELGAPSVEEGLEKIYGMLEDKGILRGLTNPDMIQYRYVVDTMAYGLRPELGGKSHLSRLAKKRGKTTAIISAPSMTQLSAAQNPFFCDSFIPGVDPKPIFDTQWIPQGGNPDMPRSFRFSFPTDDNGARYCGIFGPFLKYVDNDRTFLVPPAADISNAFVRKFLGGDPFAIVANKNGIISNSNVGGVEYNLDQTDRDYLEPFGYNSIIERPQTAQVLIYSNRTSYQTVRSDYNYLHVRELLNTIELQVDDVLKQFVFDYNNPVSRLNVVNSVTPILESIKDAGALFDYEIIMDETNNTKELIDEGFGMIDIGVWINKGMEKIINRITVNKLGTASSGGFTAV
jgi:hypothetical protein